MHMATMVISDATNRKLATQGCLSKIFVLRSIIKLDKKLLQVKISKGLLMNDLYRGTDGNIVRSSLSTLIF